MSTAATSPQERDARLQLLIGVYVLLYAAANVGSVMAPRIVERNPELLLALSSRIRHLLFAVPAGVSPGLYGLIGFIRIVVAGTVCFLLGRWYGTRGFAWLDRQLGDQRPAALRWIEAATDRVGPLFVFLMPGSNIVCALVGHRRMAPRLFFSLMALGTVARLWWVWLAADHFESELKDALGWISRYQWWLVGGFFALTVFQAWRRGAATSRATATIARAEPDESETTEES